MMAMGDLSGDEVRLVLYWASVADFEGKIDEVDVLIIDRLAEAIGENAGDYYPVFRATQDR